MKKKRLYMIGNSHIDPVWFWDYEEGLQEVKATFASALMRMREFEDYKFTCTSTAFFKWIEKLLPEMFEEIRERVKEGRWEITGGWFIEPDCILPCGEAFVRHGLYGQRYVKEKFGAICRIGSNVDSFGHNANLPQILKKSGMDSYIFMRPRLDTPVFRWESKDGSYVNAVCLPAEYTTWFKEPTIQNIETTLERTQQYDKMVCCYGVGNHGGGPTIENIRTIQELQKERQDVELRFSDFTEFLQDTKELELPVLQGPFEGINQGCYSVDSEFKRKNRMAEARLLEADLLMSMARLHTGKWMKEAGEMESLWEILHFNEFHDTMGGTTIKPARDEAVMQLSAVCAKAGYFGVLARQEIAACLNTAGTGFPLILFHTGSMAYEGNVEVELEWFCQSPLKLLAKDGTEIPYQRVHTEAKVRHTVLGGRRRIVFRAQIPPYGYAVYRVVKEKSALCSTPDMEVEDTNALLLENEFLLARWDKETGLLCALIDKTTGYDALKQAAGPRLYVDERDAWGHSQGGRYEDRNAAFCLESIQKVESGKLRQAVRVCLRYEGTRLEQIYTLGAMEKELKIENRLCFHHTWSLLKLAYPVGAQCHYTQAETAYGIVERNLEKDSGEYNMQRFLNVEDEKGRGLCIANDGKYAFHMEEGSVGITVARSAIYAQGNSPDWKNEIESYEYTDIGMQTFSLLLRPHGNRLPEAQFYQAAQKINNPCHYLADSVHPEKRDFCGRRIASIASTDLDNVAVVWIKKAQDDDGFIVRLLELSGLSSEFTLVFAGKEFSMQIGHHELLTLKISSDIKTVKKVNLLEWEEEVEE